MEVVVPIFEAVEHYLMCAGLLKEMNFIYRLIGFGNGVKKTILEL